MNKIHSLLFLFLIFTTNGVLAVGLGVNPAYLSFDIYSVEDFEKEIYVINNESDRFDFRLYSDSDAIKTFPEQLLLDGGENQRIMVRLDPKKFNSNFEATLFIVSSDPEKPDVRIGIKMPINVKISNNEALEKAIEKSLRKNKGKTEKEETGSLVTTGLFGLASQDPEIILIGIMTMTAIAFLIFARKRKN